MTDLPPLLPRISDYAGWHATRRPETVALKLDDRAWTYAELASAVDRLARALMAAGIRRGDRVATLQTPHPQYLIDFLATVSIGAIWVGLNPRYQLEELLHVVADSEPAILLARRHIGDRCYDAELAALAASCLSLHRVILHDEADCPAGTESMAAFLRAGEAIDAEALLAARASSGGRDPCLIVYTSGSTGAPKGALLHHEGLARFSLGQNRLWPLSPLRVINYFPINHVGCVADCSLPCLVAGGTTIFMEKFDPARCLALMARERVTLWGSVPSTFPMILDLPDFADHDLSAVELIVWGGAAMGEDVLARLATLGPPMATNYGMTETTSAITAIEPTHDLEALAHSVGDAFPDVEVRLCDANGTPAAEGDIGEVQTRSALNFLGYWRRPEATAEAFTEDGYFRTGDLAARRPDGRYRIAGRIKEMYKSGGYNVYPREIEAVLESHPAVNAAAVVAMPDPVWQEIGVAFVTLAAPVAPADLDAFCRGRLANYKLPKHILIETELPLLPIGKVDKTALKRRLA